MLPLTPFTRKLAFLAALLMVLPVVSGAYIGTAPSWPEVSSGGQLVEKFTSFVANETASLNLSDGAAVKAATLEIEGKARENATRIRDALRAGGNVSGFLHNARTSLSEAAPPGVRTNLNVARGPTGLYDATVALYADLGYTLSVQERLAIQQQASLVPANVALMGALATYAAIDAIHYTTAAFAAVDHDAWATVEAEPLALSMLARRYDVTSGPSGPEVSFDASDEALLEAVSRLVASVDVIKLFQAADVLAQAVDEIKAIPNPSLEGNQPGGECSTTNRLIFAPLGCLIVIGDSSAQTYLPMQVTGSGREMNLVLIDLGGNDLYTHRAGGGWSAQDNNQVGCLTGTPPKCWAPVQLNIDLGTGADSYIPWMGSTSAPKVEGVMQGAGSAGVGVLYDQGGNDRYNASAINIPTKRAVLAQGAATLGVGLLLDESGNDVYEAWQSTRLPGAHAQGAALAGGLGILRDSTGLDGYHFNLTHSNPTTPTDGGGAQGFAAGGGIAALVDLGTQKDTYRAGQDYVQGAAALGSVAILFDEGGENRFEVVSSLGCQSAGATAPITSDPCGNRPYSQYRPVAGWSQAYADTGAFAALLTGTGKDTYLVTPFDPASTWNRADEDRFRLGAAGPAGFAIFHDRGGDDTYAAREQSLGSGWVGVAVFSDSGGNDHYKCVVLTCHGHGGENGAGIYHDGTSSGDIYDDGMSATATRFWAQDPPGIGLGIHVAPGGCSGGCGPPTLEDEINGRMVYTQLNGGMT